MKKLCKYVCISLVAFVFVACGNKTSNESSTSKKGKKVEISYAIWDSGQEKGLRKIADKFQEKNPNIKINFQVVNWDTYWTMLEAGATGGTLPDTFWMHSNEIYRYASNDMLLGLDDYISKSSEVKLSNYPEGLNKIYNVKKKQYAIPKDYDTVGLWYNKKMFDNAGIEYPNGTWNWNKLYEVSKKLTKEDGSQYGFLAPLINQEGFYNFIYQNGGTVITDDKKSGYDNPKTMEALKFYMRFVQEKLSPSVTDDKKRAELLQNGQVAMAYFGSWNLSSFTENDYIKNNYDVAVLPTGNNGKRSTIFNGLGNTISAKTKYPEESWKWIEFLSSKEGQEMQAILSIAISAYSGADQTWVNSNKNFHVKSFIDMLQYAQIRPYSNSTSKWEEKAYELLKPAYLGTKSVEESSKDVAKMMNEELSSEK